MTGSGRYSADEARRVLERAARIQAEDDGGRGGDLTTADLTQAADQAGISSSALLRAIAEERGLESGVQRDRRISRSGVEQRVHLPVPVSEAALDRAWDVVVKERGDLGHVHEVGNSRIWHPRHDSSDGFEVGVRRGDASTDVWIRRKNPTLSQGWLPFAVLGGLFAMGFRTPSLLLLGAALFFGIRWIVRARAARSIGDELDRLAREIEAEIARPDPEPSG